MQRTLREKGIQTNAFNSSLLAEPGTTLNRSGEPYRVYTPYLRRMLHDLRPSAPLAAPTKILSPGKWPAGEPLDSLDPIPRIAWYTTLEETWRPGEEGARARLNRFMAHGLADYRQTRDLPARRGTSGLSPHLHFGEIGPRQIWHALGAKGRSSSFLHEIIWREFAHHLLFHFPRTTTQPMRPEFARFPWKKNTKLLHAWQRGRTGIPLVDAGMRELWATGVMHNRVRMVVGSFLVKNLLQPWQDGARWFWDTLVDADLANNTLNWQWVAGCGADAAPYFRIFNPITQAERYDPDAAYVRRWVPEFDDALPPRPLVDLAATREAALDAYARMRGERMKK